STQSFDDYKVNIETSMGDITSSWGTVPSTFDLNAQNLPKNICQVQPDLRRSGKNVKLPAKSNDYIVGSSRKYGLKNTKWNAKLTMDLLENGFLVQIDYSLFTKKSDKVFIALLVYMDDIVTNGNDLAEIEKFKVFLKSRFQIKDLEKLKYFLGIEVLDNKEGICLSQRKYCL
nr:ribonuclease H-like domain-containing protein [Tanacetum cinerariifolium]